MILARALYILTTRNTIHILSYIYSILHHSSGFGMSPPGDYCVVVCLSLSCPSCVIWVWVVLAAVHSTNKFFISKSDVKRNIRTTDTESTRTGCTRLCKKSTKAKQPERHTQYRHPRHHRPILWASKYQVDRTSTIWKYKKQQIQMNERRVAFLSLAVRKDASSLYSSIMSFIITHRCAPFIQPRLCWPRRGRAREYPTTTTTSRK